MSAAWRCPNCMLTVEANYCAQCGERALQPSDLSLAGLATQIWRTLTNLDGRVLRSFAALVTQPGALTRAYLQGQRRPYIAPFQLFVLANLLFFGLQSFAHMNVFSSPLSSHLELQDWHRLARTLLEQRLSALQTNMPSFAPRFDAAVIVNAKSLIILMTLPFAALTALLFRSSRQPGITHLVFALHHYAFLLILFCASLVIAEFDVLLGGKGLASQRTDTLLSLLNLLVCAVYLDRSIRVVYGAVGLARTVKLLILTTAVALIVPGYRFALFILTLYTTA